MKTLWLFLMLIVTGSVFGEPPKEQKQEEPVKEEPTPERTPEVATTLPTILDEMPKFSPPSPADWGRSEGGVLIQMIEAPTPLAPLNPFAPTEAGFGFQNISLDTTSNRPMGLRLLTLRL